MTISAIIITFNEEKNIESCLKSIQWVDEIIVVDSLSTDRTVSITKKFTENIIETEWRGYAENKNIALDNVTCDWVLWVDADERVTLELQKEIKDIMKTNPVYNGFEIPRKAFFLGKWIRHCGWYPGYVLRLFRRGSARFNAKKVHEGLELEGEKSKCKNDLLHFTDDNLEHYLWKFNRYTTLAARELNFRNKTAGIFSILFRPVHTFIKMYVVKRGFLDGVEGFILCNLSAAYVFVKYAKLWHLNLSTRKTVSISSD